MGFWRQFCNLDKLNVKKIKDETKRKKKIIFNFLFSLGLKLNYIEVIS